jgi:RNA polymerase sigma factor (sigma-70 family)
LLSLAPSGKILENSDKVHARRSNYWMADAADSSTNPTLLGRLRRSPDDPAAWDEFVRRYGRRIFRWGRQLGLQEADAEDVTQTVLLDLARQMRDFAYDPAGSFRGWLKTITYRAWRKLVEGRQRPGNVVGTGGTGGTEPLAEVQSGADLWQQVEEECNRELLEHAMNRVRVRVRPNTWEVFRLLVVEAQSSEAVAARLGMKVSQVYIAKSKVQKLIREEVARLDQPDARRAGASTEEAGAGP